MWLQTRVGFFSIVRKPADIKAGMLTVRARVRDDLQNLRDRFLPELGEIVESSTSDYRYRARVPSAALAEAMGRIALDIDYSNFKDTVALEQGPKRAKLYHGVWNALLELQRDPAYRMPVKKKPDRPVRPKGIPHANTYGGVLINENGEVLLREPANHVGDYVWTFAKGKPDKGELPDATALREVLKETGYRAEIITPLPWAYRGSSKETTAFFLMRTVGPQGKPSWETRDTRWVKFSEAPALIKQTITPEGRQRDLDVLADAETLFRELRLHR